MNLRLNAAKVVEQRNLLNKIRDDKETTPVEITFSEGTVTVDCNEKAESRMSNALLLWDSLNIVTLDWTLSDNTLLTLTKPQLQELYDTVLVARGTRSLNLHAYTTSLKATLPVFDDNTIFDSTTWAF
jgi:hypothetical protein|tara:strand:- start:590 stop:973 length:384 start_codon:yes stop_codon:yes gene_type:complete